MNIPTTADVVKKLKDGQAPPVAAMRVAFAPVEMAATGNSEDAKTIKVNLKARQKGYIDHPWWGRVWHDLSTVRFRPRVAIDDTHDVEVGYGRPFQSEYGLEVDGVVITNPDNAQHPANRIAYNLRNGIPQEASIDFAGDYHVVEVKEGLSMPVNGLDAQGPCLVVKDWQLRAVAICKEGADASTETTALNNQGSATAPLPRSITEFSLPQETAMETPSLVTPEPQPISVPAEVVEAPAAETPLETEAQPAEVPTVEASAVIPPTDAVTVLAATATELEELKTQFVVLTAQLADKDAQLAALTQRLAVATQAGAPPIVSSAPTGPQSWQSALATIQKEKPNYALWQVHVEAQQRFPELFQKVKNSEK